MAAPIERFIGVRLAEETMSLTTDQDQTLENTDTNPEADKLNINAPGRPNDKKCNDVDKDLDCNNIISDVSMIDKCSSGQGEGGGAKDVDNSLEHVEGGGAKDVDNSLEHVEGGGAKDLDPEQAYAEGKISKKQLKRLRREEAWRKKKEFLKTKRKEQRRLEAQKRREKGEPNKKRLRLEFEKRLETSDVTIAVDLSFDDLMMEQDIKKLMKQIERCYAVNKRAPVPVQMHLSSVGGRCRHRMETAIAGWKGWKVGMQKELYTEVFERERIVYLTSDSPNTLSTLEAGKVYIIGGLVDHNSHKGLCYQRACEAGVSHAQLPIAQFVKIQSRKVLAVNHVFEIMLAYLELQDWQEAFLRVIPPRKGVEAITADQPEDNITETEGAEGQQTPNKNGPAIAEGNSEVLDKDS
ncbi:PREDICTED: tRNA methyltransferase 10 homolog A-like isoform X1 [Branchiostoma belcheri]|uniref:tRNA methyltransferase 10 homolog A n=1 Tax=Branchiostoma belcheri TaxID=7741 RepID=A0A6P4XTK6_BRABE|nr:PREDICTED: tRNA methyltransferase 10 homolog A-like isoform X1 [Branchiostoma belcheri]